MIKTILALDTGTTSMRGVLYGPSGNLLFLSQKNTPARFLPGERVEQDPLTWSRCLTEILREAARWLKENRASLEAVTLTAFRSPVFPLDRDKKPLHPAILWQDKRTDELCRRLEPFADRVFNKTGLPMGSVFSGVKMRWFAENTPEIHKKTVWFSGVYEYLLYLLTGDFLTDTSVASRSNLFNLNTGTWDRELLDLFLVKEEQLAAIVPAGSVCGTLQDSLCTDCGLPRGVPVAAGGGDQQCAALGMGVTGPGRFAVNIGTGAYIIGQTDTPVFDPRKRIYCNGSAMEGRFILESGMLTAGTVYRWFSERFYDPAPEKKDALKAVNGEAALSPPGANAVLLLPYLMGGDRSAARPDVPGVFYNVSLSTSRGDMARAILEGIALELGEKLHSLEALCSRAELITVSGGLTRLPLFNQILADVFQRPLSIQPDGEATSLGAWVNTAIALHWFSTHKEALTIALEGKTEVIEPEDKNFPLYRELALKKKSLCDVLPPG